MRKLNWEWKSCEATGLEGSISSCDGVNGVWKNDYRLRVWVKVKWIVFHSDCKHLHQRLPPAIHQFSEPEQ